MKAILVYVWHTQILFKVFYLTAQAEQVTLQMSKGKL